MNKMSVKDLKDLHGKKVLVRCDFNVPMKDGVITDENRIIGAMPTIKYGKRCKSYTLLTYGQAALSIFFRS